MLHFFKNTILNQCYFLVVFRWQKQRGKFHVASTLTPRHTTKIFFRF